MPMCSVQELQALEEAAWASPARRALYSTRYVPGFPWHTVYSRNDSSASTTLTPSFVRRHVVPYDYPFTVFVKGRWVGRKLLDVYSEELPHHTPAYYEACARTGRLYCVQRSALGRHNTQRKIIKRSSVPTLNLSSASNAPPREVKEASSAETTASSHANTHRISDPHFNLQEVSLANLNVVLQHGDVVYHTVHRHEVPVIVGASGVDPVVITCVRIELYGLICVNKPTGLPTHATGRYMYNSLTALLEYVLAPKRLHAWLMTEDPLLQSLVSTAALSSTEKQELYFYYHYTSTNRRANSEGEEDVTRETESEVSEVEASKLPRPCHRLDKVTSGVLLLAVRQDAAKRIGTVLMKKAKEVDEAVTAELRNSNLSVFLGDVDSIAAHSLPFPLSLQRIMSRTYELQKRYLARVVGVLHDPSKMKENGSADSDTLKDTVWSFSGSEACLKYHNNAVRSLLSSCPSISKVASLTTVDRNAEPLKTSSMFPAGLLITAPIFTRAHSSVSESGCACSNSNLADRHLNDTNRSFRGERKSSDTQPNRELETAALSSATFCQSLWSTITSKTARTTINHTHAEISPSGLAPSSSTESLVLCTPYTGRLHQIRSHLSSLGCHIVGDVVYTPAAHSDDVIADGKFKPSLSSEIDNTTSEEALHGWARTERDYVYFDAAQLPTACRRFCGVGMLFQMLQEEEVSAAMLGVKRDRAYAEAPNNTASSAWQQEPFCYECAGWLPIVAMKECATGTSAICLHAWSYEIKESLLLQQTLEYAKEGGTAHTLEDEAIKSEVLPASENADALEQMGGARVVDGGYVRFEAPPPAWAFIPQEQRE